jgi:hypothetical protein
METNQTLISAGISVGSYIVYKTIQRYYIRSGCHDKTLEITIVDKDSPSGKPAENSVEMTSVAVDPSEPK